MRERNHGTWDLFLPVNQHPSSIGVWYFLLPTSLVVVGVLSVRFAPPKKLPNLLVLGTVDPVAHHQLLVFSSSLAFFRVFPSIIAGWPCGLFFGPQGEASGKYFAPRGSLWLHYGLGSSCLSLPFSSRFSINNVFGHWALLANCLIYLVQSYQVEEGGHLEDLSDDVWGQYPVCSSQ